MSYITAATCDLPRGLQAVHGQTDDVIRQPSRVKKWVGMGRG
jgi:hypothetical protein